MFTLATSKYCFQPTITITKLTHYFFSYWIVRFTFTFSTFFVPL